MNSDYPASDSFAELEKQLEKCSHRHHAEPCAKLQARIRHECTRDLRCKRRMPRGARFAWSVLFVAAGIALFGSGSPGDLSRSVLVGATASSVVLGLVLFAGVGSAPGKRPAWSLRCALLCLLPVLFLSGSAFLATHSVSTDEFFGSEAAVNALACSLRGLGSGVLIAGAVLLLWRRTDPFSPGLTGAIVGLVGGLAGAIGVGLWCPSTEVCHRLFHGLAVLGVVLMGWLAGRRWLAP